MSIYIRPLRHSVRTAPAPAGNNLIYRAGAKRVNGATRPHSIAGITRPHSIAGITHPHTLLGFHGLLGLLTLIASPLISCRGYSPHSLLGALTHIALLGPLALIALQGAHVHQALLGPLALIALLGPHALVALLGHSPSKLCWGHSPSTLLGHLRDSLFPLFLLFFFFFFCFVVTDSLGQPICFSIDEI